jgi:cytochrome P450
MVPESVSLFMGDADRTNMRVENSPFKKLAKCYEAYIEFGKYLEEMVAAKKATTKSKATESSDESLDVDLISQLLKAQKPSDPSSSDSDQTLSLSESDVMGNLFMFIIAGHETSANSIHFSIILLALHPSLQRKVQHELSAIFQGRPVSAWSYDVDLKQLFNSLLAAVLNEELRLIGPVIAIPKIVSSAPQCLSINGRDCVFPAETMIRLCVSSVHHNPNFWPARPPKVCTTPASPPGNRENDLEEFRPERWTKCPANSSEPATGTPLYVPPKGAFIPFSDGQRACLGKRFAQIEVLAALAVIFSEYSVELAVDEWASDQVVAVMRKSERKVLWEMAEKKARSLLRDKVSSIITLQLRGAQIPVRFVKRGTERFWDL